MSSQPKGLHPPKPGASAPKVTPRRNQRVDHAEIVRMAESEAAGRATNRHNMIALAAYFRAQERGFEPGHELEDWVAAETEFVHDLQVSAAISEG
ncbi:DUF2934 domain-containing protein [Peristeroidobacter soli]|jgi:hypothetical protein|uniref:DUF2934 domain-containing protein n=1 Tax=Peristeroidobacter soli TaxID=2497877 RepID=UPI00101C1E49|nr:DUF2934 domain-containing protein [Peristeroidobacter soli]